MCDEKWILQDNQLGVGLRSSSKALPKAKLAPKRGCGHCLVVCCPSDPRELSESQWNHYSWEVCSASQWEVPKPATLAAGIGQQKNEPNSSPQHHLTTGHTTKASKAQSMDHEMSPHLPYSPDLSPTDDHFLQASQQLFTGKMLPQLAGGRKCFPRAHWTPKHGFYATGIKKLLSHWKTCVDCNGSCLKKDVLEPSYSDWKFTVWNHNYFCINLIYTLEYHSPMKRTEVLIHGTMWMNL